MLIHYRVMGPEGVSLALEQLVGGLAIRIDRVRDSARDEPNHKWFGSLGEFIRTTAATLKLAEGAAWLLEHSGDVIPMLPGSGD